MTPAIQAVERAHVAHRVLSYAHDPARTNDGAVEQISHLATILLASLPIC
jgi:hypothetical protein